ncbi:MULTISPECIES: hypothetical protein [Haloarcula]|uniref:hypothetical protein n=1 Tax=Haloarcula TaxID=2237 RepID=UPI0023E7E9D7|nr:hypothetical protein [Halomicroarcula sp. SHR3]
MTGDINSAAEFESALADIVESAIENNVDVRGSWEFETEGSTHYWELNVVELARESDKADETD